MIKQLQNHRIAVISYLGLGLLMALVGLVLHRVAPVGVTIEYLKYGVVLLFFVNVAATLFIQKLPVYHPYVMFLGMFALFILTRIIFDVFGGVDFAQTNMFSDYKFDTRVQRIMLINIALSLWGLQVGSLVSTLFHKVGPVAPRESDMNWIKVGLFFFYVGLPFLAYQYIMGGIEVVEKGYASMLSGELEYRNSLLTTIMSRLSLCGFWFYLAGLPKNKRFYLHLGLFVLVFSLQLLLGMRGVVMCTFLMLLYYVLSFRSIKNAHLSTVAFIVVLFIVSAFVGSFRSHEKFADRADWAYDFLYNQGVSVQVLGYAVQYEEAVDYEFENMFSHLRFRFDLIKRRLGDFGDLPVNKIQMMERYGTLSFQLTHKVNSRALFLGWDMASSYLAELYLLGRGGLALLVNILIGFMTVFGVASMEKTNWGILSLLFILPSWLYVPRDNLFDFLTDNVTNVIFVGILFGVLFVRDMYTFQQNIRRHN